VGITVDKVNKTQPTVYCTALSAYNLFCALALVLLCSRETPILLWPCLLFSIFAVVGLLIVNV